MRPSSILLLVGIVAAAAFALVYGSHTPAPLPPAPTNAQNVQEQEIEDPGVMGAGMETQELPPNHPPINGTPNEMGAAPNDSVHAGLGGGAMTGGGGAGGVAPEDEPAALTWKAPATWTLVPNPNNMRLATYKVSDAELVVSRAGGDVATNVQRWTGQFGSSFTLKQSTKTIHTLKVTQVLIDGTYQSGAMSGATASHDNWSMLGAIVETKGQPYFFKLIGPAATVHGAQKPFEGMLDTVTAN